MTNAKDERLAHSEYWDEYYTGVEAGKQAHEWFKSFSDLEPVFSHHLFGLRGPETNPQILHLGSGESTIPEDLARKGYTNQLCVDFSPVVVQTMVSRHADIEGITWMQIDVRQMDAIPSDSIDVAFDKGTLDAMIHGSPWSPPDDVLDNTSRYMREVYRVLKYDAIFIYVSFRQPHFLRPLLSCEDVEWDIDMNTLGGSNGSFEYFVFVMNKKRSTTRSVPGWNVKSPMEI